MSREQLNVSHYDLNVTMHCILFHSESRICYERTVSLASRDRMKRVETSVVMRKCAQYSRQIGFCSQILYVVNAFVFVSAEGRLMVTFFFFFFQAEDGIRDLTVTGVQTCALPI